MKTNHTLLIILPLFILLITGCSSTMPEPIIVEQTVISEIPITVEVTSEVPVTVEVTRLVEPTPEPVKAAPVVEVTLPRTEAITVHATASDRDYDIQIGLPEFYYSKRHAYPVVYLLDSSINFMVIAQYSRILTASNLLPKVIIVGIDTSSYRDRDLDPDNQEGAGDFLAFMQDDLIPYIDDNYRTEPTDRTLAGGSLGGQFTLYALFHAPETFNRFIATTPALNRNDLVFEYEEEFASAHSDLPVKLFMSVGELESAVSITELYEKLEGRNYDGLDMNMNITEDAGHFTAFIRGFIDGLQLVFR
jgi:predicted alpha/beta superfamily hydrolase